jgi:hypothetical protein
MFKKKKIGGSTLILTLIFVCIGMKIIAKLIEVVDTKFA